MKLVYYKKHQNFGDALNPLILNRFFPDFFDEDEAEVFIGIGSILHMEFPERIKKIVFSTGYAFYGKKPLINESYDISCVRGPLTANVLGLDPKLAITDGAALLSNFNFSQEKKIHKFSYIPHHESCPLFDWKGICSKAGFWYIDPSCEPQKIIQEILQSEVVIAEAMHGAIVADSLRIPWIPVKFYKTINTFKWEDWTASLNLKYSPHQFKPLYNEDSVREKLKLKFQSLHPLGQNFLSSLYSSYQFNFITENITNQFSNLRFEKPILSDENIFKSRVEQLLEKTYEVNKKYRADRGISC